MTTIIVRTDVDPGDTMYVSPDVDWAAAGRDYIARLDRALRAAYPDAVIDVELHDMDTDTVRVVDEDGIDVEDEAQAVRELVGATWQAWVESLPRREERRSVPLPVSDWAVIDTLAARLGCVATSGPEPRRASWRVLLRRIAAGELDVVER